jgi:hypothetical protein
VNYQGKYGRIDPSAAAPTLEGTETLGQGMFSPDGKVFAYTTWGQLPDENTGWVFNTLELETGKTASFKGVFVSGAGAGGKPAPLPELGMYGIPIPIGWAAAAHPIVTGIVPFSDIASLGSVYILDLDKSGNGRLARARLLGQGLPESSRPVFSPDGKKFAYFSSDPARVTNCLAGLNEPDNTVTIMDVAGGRLTVAAAPQGQCIGRSSLIWTADGKALTTTGSEDLDAARAGSAGVSMVSERLFFVDSVSGVASQGAELLAGRRGRIGELLACGSTLYFTVLHYEGKAFATTIVAALMNNPSEQTVVAELNSLASLESCIP